MASVDVRAPVILGATTAAFAVCFIAAFSSLDRLQLWRDIEASAP